MSLLLALSLPAHALGQNEYMLCLDQQVWDTVPAADAVDVPVDLQPSVLFSHGACATDKRFTISLLSRIEGQEALVAQVELDSPADTPTPWAPLDLDAPLEPYTDFILRVESLDGFGGLVELGFETGEGSVQGHAGAPSLDSLSHTWSRRRGQVSRSLDAELTAAPDPDGLGVVLLRDAEDPQLVYGAQTVDDTQLFMFVELSPVSEPEPICAEAVQLDGRGEITGQSEVICAEAQRLGCSVGGGRGSLALALGAILGLIRRRRRSG
ncbi:MAG: hypothetical protein H6740_20170 [Alphaproteobacteria bacterium]|nr:hypothetical protein [Alphaproteobacteria bacterium]